MNIDHCGLSKVAGEKAQLTHLLLIEILRKVVVGLLRSGNLAQRGDRDTIV